MVGNSSNTIQDFIKQNLARVVKDVKKVKFVHITIFHLKNGIFLK
jgi:hypothetical protein